MNTEHLKYVVEVAKAGSITAASEKLYISIPGISQAIKSLEKEFGVKLFTSSRLGTVPTEEGKIVIKKAYGILNQLNELHADLSWQAPLFEQKLTISATPSFFINPLFKAILTFQEKYPNIHIEIIEKDAEDIFTDIKENKVDLGLTPLNNKFMKQTDFVFEDLFSGKLVFYVSKNSALALSDTIIPEEIIKHNIALYNGKYMNKFVDRFTQKYGSIKKLIVSNNPKVIETAVSKDLAIACLPKFEIDDDPYNFQDKIIPLTLTNHEPIHLNFGYIYNMKKPLSTLGKSFIHYLKHEINEVKI